MAAFDYCVYLWLEMVFLPYKLMGQNAQFQDEREASES